MRQWRITYRNWEVAFLEREWNRGNAQMFHPQFAPELLPRARAIRDVQNQWDIEGRYADNFMGLPDNRPEELATPGDRRGRAATPGPRQPTSGRSRTPRAGYRRQIAAQETSCSHDVFILRKDLDLIVEKMSKDKAK